MSPQEIGIVLAVAGIIGIGVSVVGLVAYLSWVGRR